MMAAEQAAAVMVEGLSLSYESRGRRLTALHDVSLAVAQGEFVALLGPSGCGKSTLLNAIAGLEEPDTGRVLIGTGLEGAAYMQQKDLLLPWRTVWGNVLLAPQLSLREPDALAAAETRAAEWLSRFGLAGFRDAYPAELSGGMRQRVALIRTLMAERELMLLDEPFGAVDALTRRDLQQELLGLWSSLGKTVILVTHDVEEALLLATRIVLMTGQPGRIDEQIPVLLPHPARARSADMLRTKEQILERLEASRGPAKG